MKMTIYPYWGFNFGLEVTESEIEGKEISHLLVNVGPVRVQLSSFIGDDNEE